MTNDRQLLKNGEQQDGKGPVLAIPAIRNLWLAGAISQVGDRLNQMALMTIVGVISHNNALLNGILLSFMFVPPILFAPIAGVVADRWNRKHILIGADLVRAVAVCFIPLFALVGVSNHVPAGQPQSTSAYETSGNAPALQAVDNASSQTAGRPLVQKNRIWIILCVVFFMFAVSPFFTPARASMIPHLVDQSRLLAVNSLLVSTRLVLVILGMLVGTEVAHRLSHRIGIAFYIDSMTYVFSAVFLAMIVYRHTTIDKKGALHEIRVSFREMLEGGKYILSKPRVRTIIAVYFFMLFFGAGAFNVLKKFLDVAYGFPAEDARHFGWALGCAGIGVAIGSVIIRITGDRVRRGWTFIGAYVLAGISLFAMHMVQRYWVTCIASGFLGMSLSPVLTLIETFFQREVPDQFRGRVFAGFEVFIGLGLAGSVILSGAIVEKWFAMTPSVMFAIAGSGMFIAAFVASGIRTIREF